MKKIGLLVTLLVTLFLLSCGTSTTSSGPGLLDELVKYQEKIQSLISADQAEQSQLSSSVQSRTINRLSYDTPYDPNAMKTREEFLAEYQNQTSTFTDVFFDAGLLEYKVLLDQIIAQIEEQEDATTSFNYSFTYMDEPALNISISCSPNSHLIIKFAIAFDEQYHGLFGIKMGFEENNFYLRELIKRDDQNFFYYSEFHENNQMVYLSYAGDSYWYRSTSQKDNTYYDIFLEDGVTHISWFDSAARISASATIGDQTERGINLWNEKGIIFSYIESGADETITVAWQLLEATGWDSAYGSETATPYNGVYKDGEKILEDAHQINIDLYSNNANVRVEMQMTKSDFSDDVLNLSAYGLDFHHPELSVAIINEKLDSANPIQHSEYNGVDFLNDDMSVKLYEMIDNDVKP